MLCTARRTTMADEPNTPPAPPPPATVGQQVAELIKTHHPHVTAAQTELVVALADRQRWSGDVTPRLEAALASLGTGAISYRPTPPMTAFNPGAPASAGSTKIPLDPAAVPQSVIDSWTP